MSAVRHFYQVLAYYASFALFALMAMVLSTCCLLIAWLPHTDARERFFQRLIHRNFALFVRWVTLARIVPVSYSGELAPAERGGRVIVANHPGLMDVGWLLARLPEAICICKPDIGRNPLYAATAHRAGYLTSDSGRHLIRTATEKLAAGRTLLVFPEGTRTRHGRLNPFKPGFVAMARKAGVPIQLVRIHCDSELLTKQRPWWLIPRLPAHVTVSLGPCLPPPGDDTAAAIREIEAWFRAEPGPATLPAHAEVEAGRMAMHT
jgi:1-acyl-sn-glycerol-3-phosphate acyltransferase